MGGSGGGVVWATPLGGGGRSLNGNERGGGEVGGGPLFFEKEALVREL